MLAICTKDGLTVGSKLYRAGEVFVLSGELGEEYKGLSDERFIRKQHKVYKEVLFRRPTPDEIRKAIAEKKLGERDIKTNLDQKQFKIAMEYLRSKALAQVKAAEAFIEKAEIEIYDADTEEEKAEVAKAPEEEKVEAPAEEEKAPEEEEAPDRKDTPPPEEPVKEPPKKKDKEKGKTK